MKRKNGFTLIELLAVIVILAIIAVIATPIIVGIIEDSRKAAFERSVEGIIHATDIDFGTQETLTNNSYTITNGEVDKTLKTPIKNIEGFNGTIKYDENGNSTYAIYNDKWCTIKDSDGNITSVEYKDGDCKIPGPYDNGNSVYFDVKNGVGCGIEDYHEDNSKTGYNGINGTGNQTSCLKFYAFLYEEGDTKVKLLLDHNTTAKASWYSLSNITQGPVNVLSKLKTDTSSWKGTVTPENYSAGAYQINYSYQYYKARLITVNEIAKITGNSSFKNGSFNGNNVIHFYFDSNTTSSSDTCKSGNTTGCKYGWLYDRTAIDCTTYGCDNNANGDADHTLNGYWTATYVNNGSNSDAWGISAYGRVDDSLVSYSGYGVRPVIEVLVSKLKN